MQRLTCVMFTNLVHYYSKRPCQCSASGQLAISLVTSLVPRLMILLFGMGMRLLVRMCTNYKMASFATDSSHRVLRIAFIDQGEVEAMKTPIGCRDPRCDKDQFCAKMTVST